MKFGDKFYYTDELNDEFIKPNVEPKVIDGKYKYKHGFFYKLCAGFTYRLFAIPYFFTYLKCNHVHFHNKKLLKQVKNTGYFVFGNHTHPVLDASGPSFMLNRKPAVVCNPINISFKPWGKLTEMWGGMPLPDSMDATKNFLREVENILNKKRPIVIYPEAHLWPYYTNIRNFSSKSFRYPVKYNKPVFSMTTTYTFRKQGKKPRVDVYLDGPFYPDPNLNNKEAETKLRDQVYNTMLERSKNSNYNYVIYEKYEAKEKDNDTTN